MQRILLGFFALVTLSACQPESRPNDSRPDVSHIDVDVQIRRFEQDLFALDTQAIATELKRLENEYPLFSQIYFDRILQSRSAPEGHAEYVKGFITFPSVQQLYDTTQVVFSNMETYQTQFDQAVRYFAYYFPEQPRPDVTTYLSEYSIGAFIYGDNQLAVGLDFFLGADYPYAQYNPNNPNFSSYLTRTFTPEHLVSKTLRPLVDDLVGQPGGQRLIDMMVHNGKKAYLLERLLPDIPDSIRWEMTASQLQWMKDNERQMWGFFLEEDLLYSAEWTKVRKYVDYSPNSPGMPPEAPGRTGNWLGYRIVQAYMDRHPDLTLPEMIALQDAQHWLTESRYKPQR